MGSYLQPKTSGQDYAHINAIDTVKRRASAIFSDGSHCDNAIDTSYHVGAIQVTPAVGETWKVERTGPHLWRLLQKMPVGEKALSGLTTPAEGQTQVGSTGPTELLGNAVNVYAPIKLHAPAALPDAVTAGVGAMIYYQGKPVFSNGTAWHDAGGTVVT